jgi:hypothetical protein
MATPKKPASKQPIPPNKKAKNMVTSNIPSLITPKGKPEKRPSRTEPTTSFVSAFGSRRMMTPQSIKSFNAKYYGPQTKKKK